MLFFSKLVGTELIKNSISRIVFENCNPLILRATPEGGYGLSETLVCKKHTPALTVLYFPFPEAAPNKSPAACPSACSVSVTRHLATAAGLDRLDDIFGDLLWKISTDQLTFGGVVIFDQVDSLLFAQREPICRSQRRLRVVGNHGASF